MEPEAASIFCQHLTKDNEQNSSVLGQLGVGEKYMVVDLGGECLIATSRVIPTSGKKLVVCNDGVHDIHLKKKYISIPNIGSAKLINFKKNLFHQNI